MEVSMISLVDGKYSPHWLDLAKKIPTVVIASQAVDTLPITKPNLNPIEDLNEARKLVSTDLVIFMKADAIWPREWIGEVTSLFEQKPTLGMVDFYLTKQGTIIHGGGGFAGETPTSHLSGEKFDPQSVQPHESGWCSLAACVVRKELLDQLGDFHYTDDWEVRVGIEARRLGWKLYTVGFPLELDTGPIQQAAPKGKVKWRGPLHDSSGYAAEGRLLYDWLPPIFDLSVNPIQWGSKQVRMSNLELQRINDRVSNDPVDITIHHGFPQMITRDRGYNIGRTMYETDKLNEVWQEGLKTADEIWAPSGFCKDLLSKYHDNVIVIPSPIDTDTYRPSGLSFGNLRQGNPERGIRSSKEVCRFLFFSEWIKRKGWRELCAAMNDAFTNEPVEVLFKTYSAIGKTPEAIRNDIKTSLRHPFGLISDILTEEELARLFNSVHCLIHPAHGEGFGRTVAEALACGIEAISIGETGLKEIQRYPIAGTFWTEVPEEAYDEMWHSTDGGHHWVDIPHDALVEELRASYQRWEAGEVRSDRDHIVSSFSGPVVSKMMETRLLQILKS